jgi:hypothetical protein
LFFGAIVQISLGGYVRPRVTRKMTTKGVCDAGDQLTAQ